jgi:cell division protein ZapA
MAGLIPVNIVIGDRTYRLKIESDDEEVLRKTVKLINDKIVEFKTNFAGKDMQDYIAMALIWFATEQTKESITVVSRNETINKLNQISLMLDKALAQK